MASQGFWFQLRYSLSGSGSKGTAMFHLLRMGARLLVFLLIVAVGFAVYLMKRTGSEHYRESFEASLKEGLTASEIELGGFSRTQGQMIISSLALQGGDDTFYSALEARNVRFRMGLLDGIGAIGGEWDTGVIEMSRLDMDLRAGADDAESSKNLAESLFRKYSNLQVNGMEIADASIRWGYSERTKGSITNSSVQVQRLDNRLRLHFRGGYFSQNWFRKLEIVNLVVNCDTDGFVFEKAELKKGTGTVNFTGLKVIGGERPLVEGTLKMRNLNLEGLLPLAQRSFVEGTISGEFQVSGSTNTTEGVGFAGQVML
ncbi:MAG: hypothetical protein EOP85_10070, partial [Verrucomicrobiaceae bacterium]